MSADIVALPTPLPIARIENTDQGWRITTRSPSVRRHYDFISVGETAEFAIVLRDEGKWPLRFSPGADAVRAIVDGLTDGDAP